MAQEQWTSVDAYFSGLLIPPDAALDAALRASAGLPPINVSPAQGKFLHLLAKICRASRILEIGTLGGYSTIWLARALPPAGRLITLEYEPKHAQVATTNIARAGLSQKVEILIGPALDTLPTLANQPPFDLIFIDADKVNTAPYFSWALELSRPGTVIVVDNVVRNGAVTDAASTDEAVLGVRRFNDLLAKQKQVDATVLQTVGAKGYDGFAVVLVLGD